MSKKLSALFSLLIFLFINVTEARKNPRICSSSCGDIHNISYPFRLKTDPADCGDPDFELSCQNNTTVFSFLGGLYHVKRISYDERLIRVADANLATGSCGLPYKSLSFDVFYLDARYRGTGDFSYSYTLNFVRCPNNISDLANSRVPCLSGNTSNVYVNLTRSSRLLSFEVPKPCRVISTLPATYEKILQSRSYETMLMLQESGFDIRWSVECRDCGRKGRGCVYASTDTTSMFKCEEEEYGYDDVIRDVLTFLASLALLSYIGLIRFIILPLVVFTFILHTYFSMRKKMDVKGKSVDKDQQP